MNWLTREPEPDDTLPAVVSCMGVITDKFYHRLVSRSGWLRSDEREREFEETSWSDYDRFHEWDQDVRHVATKALDAVLAR